MLKDFEHAVAVAMDQTSNYPDGKQLGQLHAILMALTEANKRKIEQCLSKKRGRKESVSSLSSDSQ